METIYNDIETRFKICEDTFKKGQNYQDAQMTSSTVSSLSSPVDSGVQMLDSESELTSVMSVSGLGCDTDILPETDVVIKNFENISDNVNSNVKLNLLTDRQEHKNIKINDDYAGETGEKEDSGKEGKISHDKINRELASKHGNCEHGIYDLCPEEKFTKDEIDENIVSTAKKDNTQFEENKDMTVKGNCGIQNTNYDYKNISTSVLNYFDKYDMIFEVSLNPSDGHNLESKSFSDDVFEMEHPIKNAETEMMNVSLNSYELLDYTLQNTKLNAANTDMHVSLSEEVNENLRINLNCPVEAVPPLSVPETVPEAENKDTKPIEEQIVFRRQRKKKSKSDTPKKRVSFHEDILNSTKIDDIHINHGFITHEPDVSLSFFQRGFIRKPDVVKGRYSWAAEGDAPYYEKNISEREIKSDIYIHHPRYSSTSSSSTASISSSIDEEDNSNSDENYVRKEPSLKSKPKSSCLKKTRSTRKYIDTNIVQEENNLKKKKSEANLLDSNIFGSLKNILNFSTSVPLAERGVPEGQEDVTVYSSSYDVTNRRRSFGSLSLKNFETIEIKPTPVNKVLEAKTNLKLTKSEGFYPNYPNIPQNLPANIILCDSNVYEHKGISYSYEYDNFQKNFEKENKPKSSTVYQMILKELNFFRRRAKDEPEVEGEEDFEAINNTSTPTKNDDKIEEVQEPEFKDSKPSTKNNSNKYSSTTKVDWSDNETISDFSEPQNPRHLSSPKRKVKRNNHYSVSQSFKVPLSENRSEDSDTARSLPSLRPSTSKTSLISRFLRNVTLKKMIDVKVQNKEKSSRRLMSLYIKGIKSNKVNDDLDKELEKEIALGQEKRQNCENLLDKKMIIQFRKELFRSRLEKLIKVFPVRSAYTTNGDTKPLLVILTDSTLYIAGMKPNSTYCNHFVLPYTELNTVLIGPNAQTIHLSNYDKDMQCIISTGCCNVTGDLVGQLEIAMRRDMNKPRLPAVKQLSMRDMVNLRRAICKQTSVEKDEEYFYYSIVNIQDFNSDMEPTPLGPTKEGPLMFKTSESESSRWETAYFILKAGVLYMLSSASQRVPLRVFPLINGSCHGARRIFNSHRPHTFQLIVEGKSLLLAAPDEYVASEWLQELVHAASGTYSHRDKNPTQSCSLLMTSDHILTVREAFPCMITSLLPTKSQHDPIKGTQALSCASIIDLTSFRLPSAEQSWCVLEFACREVHEYTGDWILYFSTNAELENFLSTLENLWEYNNENGDSFPLTTIPETDPLSKKCVDVYTSLIGAWPSNTVLLQFV
ncbi:uncharacterized protein LOC108916016 [Anoplophora glabripennis]|nr:uncharacterized protein LOC108916016 [Anoplophora glabripennis]XP_018577713.1 uncharacterized protein LOC108916016 [Anoplophora glabripennis]XP_018577715.1 uncharacterized protein LOC108916016 [Anoplophora glabripennis]